MREAQLVARCQEIFAGAIAVGALDLVDDAARLPPAGAGDTRVVCADQVVEGQHFVSSVGTPADAGWRLVVRNLSDLASMGARPVGFVWTFALPEAWTDAPHRLDAFWEGAAEAARRYGCPLFGGDLARTDGPMVASLTAFGDVEGSPLTRQGAKAGHHLHLSRPVGASSAGLAELLADGSAQSSPAAQAHLRPEPELARGAELVGRASACMDVSDGLLLDLDRMLRASGVGAVLDGSLLQHAGPIISGHAGSGEQARARALSGGEDYALLVASPEVLPELARIGRVVVEPGIQEDTGEGTLIKMTVAGFDHFERPGAGSD